MLRKEGCPFNPCNSIGVRDIRNKFADFAVYPPRLCLFYYKTMVNNINNFGVINFYENNNSNAKKEQAQKVEEVIPLDEPEPVESIIFTKKTIKETKQAAIIDALQKSVQGRKDKTRAFVDELHSWQNDGYVDAHYNAKVMYDELEKLTPLAFGYEAFKKYYNNTI